MRVYSISIILKFFPSGPAPHISKVWWSASATVIFSLIVDIFPVIGSAIEPVIESVCHVMRGMSKARAKRLYAGFAAGAPQRFFVQEIGSGAIVLDPVIVDLEPDRSRIVVVMVGIERQRHVRLQHTDVIRGVLARGVGVTKFLPGIRARALRDAGMDVEISPGGPGAGHRALRRRLERHRPVPGVRTGYGLHDPLLAQVKDGALAAQQGSVGQPGSLALSGKIQPDGKASIDVLRGKEVQLFPDFSTGGLFDVGDGNAVAVVVVDRLVVQAGVLDEAHDLGEHRFAAHTRGAHGERSRAVHGGADDGVTGLLVDRVREGRSRRRRRRSP